MKFLFDEPFGEVRGFQWSPRADVYRTSTGWVVKFDLAGVKPRDVSIKVRGSVLRVEGVRRDYCVERGFRHHSMEISYSRFERAIRLPCEADGATITTEFTEGMLMVTIDTEDTRT